MTTALLARIGSLSASLFRSRAIAEVRGEIEQRGSAHSAALQQATLTVEVARRIAEPTEPLPKGSRSALLIGLYREAIRWALISALDPLNADAELSQLLPALAPERLAELAGSDQRLAAVWRLLLREPASGWLSCAPQELAAVRGFAEALIRQLRAPEHRLKGLLRQRAQRSAALVLVAGVCGAGLAVSLRERDRALDRPFTTSSRDPTCEVPGECRGLLFHTRDEAEPWVTFDLGSAQSVHRVDVFNREDCCTERALPLVIELGKDAQHFHEVSRRNADFTVWRSEFPRELARFVRLRVARRTMFHLARVEIR